MNDKLLLRLLMTAISLVLIGLGGMAILTQTHTGYARFKGEVTLEGAQASAFGYTMLWLALMPLTTWLPQRFLAKVLIVWFVGMMGLVFWFVRYPHAAL